MKILCEPKGVEDWLIVITCLALILIIGVTITLLHLNSWSQKIYSPILSIFFVAVITSLISSFFQLKTSNKEISFITSVIISREIKLPISLNVNRQFVTKIEGGNDIFFERQNEMSELSNRMIKRLETDSMTENDSSHFARDVIRECIQYQIIQYLASLASAPRTHLKNNKLTYRTTFTLSDNTIYHGRSFEKELEKNHLYFYEALRTHSSLIDQTYSFPKDTKLQLDNKYSIHNPDENEHKLTLKRKNYFLLEIIVKNFEQAYGVIDDSAKLDIAEEAKQHFGTSYYKVIIKYSFPKLTSLSEKQEEYKKWIEWLTKEISSKFGDIFDSKL